MFARSVHRALERLAAMQSSKPGFFLAVALLLSAISIPFVARLSLNSDFQALLPSDSPSVRDLDEIRARFGGTSTLTLAVQNNDIDALHDFTAKLAPEIAKLAANQVTSVDWNVSDFETFVSERRHLYANLSDLQDVKAALEARVEYERNKANPFFIDLDGEAPPDPQSVLRRIEDRANDARRQMDRFPQGFYQHPTRPMVFVFVRTAIRGGEVGATQELIRAVEEASDAILDGSPAQTRSSGQSVAYVHGNNRIDFGGDLMDVLEETDALKESVEKSTLITFGLLFGAIYIFFLQFRALPLLGLALVAPLLMTFAFGQMTVGSLNASSAFLGSIIAGNGINSMIVWLARFMEERRRGLNVDEALRVAHVGTWEGTISASLAAALAYGALMVTSYRGFRDFGIIGFCGMVLSWVAAYTVLPALAVAFERIRPMRVSEKDRGRQGIYGIWFSKLSLSSPRTVLFVSLGLTLVTLVTTGWLIKNGPLEYDFRRLQAERSSQSRVQFVNDSVGDTVEETRSGSAVAILAPKTTDVGYLRARLAEFSEQNPNTIGAVRSIDDLMPADQAAKIPLLAELRSLLLEVKPFLDDEQQALIAEHIPPENVTPVLPEQLPLSVSRPFVERDGTRGRLIFVEHGAGQNTWDGRYMVRWASAVRSVRTSDGVRPPIAGVAVVFADLLVALEKDGPLVLAVALFAIVLLTWFTFGKNSDRFVSLASLFAGVLWMTGTAAIFGMKLNFLNMVAFPIAFGCGVDYSVNVLKRYRQELGAGKGAIESLREAVESTGGAVVLCSLTTAIGYISLYTSTNQALNSFGVAMSIAEITCLGAALISMPAIILLLIRRPGKKTPELKSNAPSE